MVLGQLETSFMSPLSYRPLVLFLSVVVIVFQLAILLKPASSLPATTARDRLSQLVWKLHDNGLDFRAVSARPDGLWDDSIYLTTTDKTLRELTQWPMNPTYVEHWAGTVVIVRGPVEGLEDSSFEFGEWTFFGDKDLVGQS
jgi:hypothetical protein